MKKLVLFDLDGTLLDTSPGILYCYKKAGEKFSLKENAVEKKSVVIGGALKDGFNKLYHIENPDDVYTVIDEYKRLYAIYGVDRYAHYDGMAETLKTLKSQGVLLAVATLKLETYAQKMLMSAGLGEYFDIIAGWDGTDGCTKTVIVDSVIDKLKVAKEDCILVGDSVYDSKGAELSGIDFIGVSYGFGILKNDSCQDIGAVAIANSPKEILEYL